MSKEEAIKIIKNGKMVEIKPTENSLKKILKWTTSRYNEFRKKEVINNILDNINKDSYFTEYIAGTYSETTGYGTHYIFLKEKDEAYLIESGSIDTIIYKLI